MALAPGTRLGAYEVVSAIGAGGPAFARPVRHLASYGAVPPKPSGRTR